MPVGGAKKAGVALTCKRPLAVLRRRVSRMPSQEEIVAQVFEMLTPRVKDGGALSEDMELVGDLGLDSVQVLDLLMEVEDRFDVSIPLNVLPDIRTVKDLSDQLHKMSTLP